ncbi:hypothetical protein [Streptomyces vastus]|uniref:Uncharacterized protein n=1 Tax=Streptomyces vastus TaxID=285451 RepID=A0ABN3RZ80_9ACTN
MTLRPKQPRAIADRLRLTEHFAALMSTPTLEEVVGINRFAHR